MKKIQLFITVMLISIGTILAQNERQIFLTGNYNFVTRNMQHGAGYAVGLNHRLSNLWWLDTEFSFAQATRIKGDTMMVGRFKTLPLNYISSGYFLSISPTVRFEIDKVVTIAIGIGPTISYQSWLYNTFHYSIPDGMFGEEELTGIDFNEGYYLGGVANIQVGIDLSKNWSLFAKGAYFEFGNIGRNFTAGLGFSYSF